MWAQERDLPRTLGQLGQQRDRIGELKPLCMPVVGIGDLALRMRPIGVGRDGMVAVGDAGERALVAIAAVQCDRFGSKL